jgi:CheY-like chemotaxis protein
MEKTARNKPLILIVEDCADNRDMYAALLTRRGFEIAEAVDGHQAIEQSFALLPDLVLMDLTLPDMDGVQAIHELRADTRTHEMPIIVVSGYSRPVPADAGQHEAWDAFLSKPCPPDLLVQQIQRLLTPRAPS